MRNDTIKNLYNGDIRPVEKQAIRGSELAKVGQEIDDAEGQLRKALGPESVVVLYQMMKAHIVRNAIIAEESYVDGFKTGARLIMEVMDDYWENQKPLSS